MRICFFGDSFVNGYGDPDYQGWVGRVCALARERGDDITAYNCGVRRATSDDIKASWLAEATPRLPAEHKAAVVFSFGANDRVMERGEPRVPPTRQMDNTRDILTAAIARWPTLFLTSPRPALDVAGGDPAAQIGAVGKICERLGIPMLDVFAASADFKYWRLEASRGDGAHPGAEGYGELASLVDQWPPWRVMLDGLRQ